MLYAIFALIFISLYGFITKMINKYGNFSYYFGTEESWAHALVMLIIVMFFI